MSDLISRQEVIEHLKKRLYETALNNCTEHPYYEEIADNRVDTWLNELPSAQPEPQWIPVSERLPEDGTDCLVSVRCSTRVVIVDMATYSTDLFNVDKEDFFGNRGESGWYYLSREYGYCKVLNVIAWMPLPEPYRAERRTDEDNNLF